jgi:soluble lytic murein transglycosylase-like protein
MHRCLHLLILACLTSPAHAQVFELGSDGQVTQTSRQRPPQAPALPQSMTANLSVPQTTIPANAAFRRALVEDFVIEAAQRNRLDPALLHAVIYTESRYHERAVSRVGAQGLMQLMPGTARDLDVASPFDPRANILGGARYLRQLLDRLSDVQLAVAAYNAGEGAVRRYRGIPPYRETQAYVRDVMALWQSAKTIPVSNE